MYAIEISPSSARTDGRYGATAFAGGCKIDNNFKILQIVFDYTFCGDWADKTWVSPGCAASISTTTWREGVCAEREPEEEYRGHIHAVAFTTPPAANAQPALVG